MSLEKIWPFLSPYAQDVIRTLSGEDEESMRVCVAIIEHPNFTDSSFRLFYGLDLLGIRDANIQVFYKEVCHENLEYMIALVRGVLLKLVPCEVLQNAMSHKGEGLDFEAIIKSLQAVSVATAQGVSFGT